MSVLAVALGVATLVGILAVSQSASGQIARRLSAYDDPTLDVTLPASSWTTPDSEYVKAVQQIPGVISTGTFTPIFGQQSAVLVTSYNGLSAEAPIIVTTPDGLAARSATFESGAMPSSSVSARDPSSIVMGAGLARKLAVSTHRGSNSVTIDSQRYTVVGIVRDGRPDAAASAALLIAPSTAEVLRLDPGRRALIVNVSPGSDEVIAQSLPLVFGPRDPNGVVVSRAPRPQVLSGQLSTDTSTLVLIVTLIVSVTTSFGIVTTMQISVSQRRQEIAIRRAMGETRTSIGLSFLAESTAIAGIGTILGWVSGVLATYVAVRMAGWTYLLPLEAIFLVPLGLIVGSISGALPSIQAARVQPTVLLRESVH